MIFFRRTEKYRLSHLKSDRRVRTFVNHSLCLRMTIFAQCVTCFGESNSFVSRTKTDGTFAHYDIRGVDSEYHKHNSSLPFH